MQPISHEFEWIRNVASRLKANIRKENSEFQKSEESGMSNQVYFMDVRSKQLEAFYRKNSGVSIGQGSVGLRQQLLELQYSQQLSGSVYSDQNDDRVSHSEIDIING